MEITQANIRIDSALRAAVKIGALSSDEYDYACGIITAGEQRSVAAHPDRSGDGGDIPDLFQARHVFEELEGLPSYGPWTDVSEDGAKKLVQMYGDKIEIRRLFARSQAAPVPQDGDDRAAFEVYMRGIGEDYLYRRDVARSTRFGEYCRQDVQDQWDTWQAALASNKAAAVVMVEPIRGWSVTVEVNAERILTISDSCLSGQADFTAAEERIIHDGARHLLAFIGAPQELPNWFEMFLTNVCELPDRNSPEDEPEAIVATLDELRDCAVNAIEQCTSFATPAPIASAEEAMPVASDVLSEAHLMEAVELTIDTLDRQLDLIAERAPGKFLDKTPVVRSLTAHKERLERAVAERNASFATHPAAAQPSRAEVLEEAATVADGFRCGNCGMDGKCAAAIRALKGKS